MYSNCCRFIRFAIVLSYLALVAAKKLLLFVLWNSCDKRIEIYWTFFVSSFFFSIMTTRHTWIHGVQVPNLSSLCVQPDSHCTLSALSEARNSEQKSTVLPTEVIKATDSSLKILNTWQIKSWVSFTGEAPAACVRRGCKTKLCWWPAAPVWAVTAAGPPCQPWTCRCSCLRLIRPSTASLGLTASSFHRQPTSFVPPAGNQSLRSLAACSMFPFVFHLLWEHLWFLIKCGERSALFHS